MRTTRNLVFLGLSVTALVVILNVLGMGQTVSCSSDDGHRQECPADTRSGVRMVKQNSDSPCQEDNSWGSDRRGVWVDHGCRADFAVFPHPYGGTDRGSTVSRLPKRASLMPCTNISEIESERTGSVPRGRRDLGAIPRSADNPAAKDVSST